jgi:hypothetical protein
MKKEDLFTKKMHFRISYQNISIRKCFNRTIYCIIITKNNARRGKIRILTKKIGFIIHFSTLFDLFEKEAKILE